MGPSAFDETNIPESEAGQPALDVTDPHAAVPGAEAPVEAEASGVEPEGFATGLMTGFILLTVALLAVAIVVVSVWVRVWFQAEAVELAAQTPYPLVQETQTHAERLLNGYGVVDADAGIYRIPVDRAMDVMLEEAHAATQTE